VEKIGGQIAIYRGLLGGKAHQWFVDAYNLRIKEIAQHEREDKPTKKDLLDRVLNDVALRVFPQGADSCRNQKRYLRNSMIKLGDQDPEKFRDQLVKINNYLEYFPIKSIGMPKPPNKPMDEDDLVDIMERGISIEWRARMMYNNQRSYAFETVDEAAEHYKSMWDADCLISHALGLGKQNESNKGKGRGSNNKRNRDGSSKHRSNRNENDNKSTGGIKQCTTCKKFHPGRCRYLDDKNKDDTKPPAKRFKGGGYNKHRNKNEQSNVVTLDREKYEALMAIYNKTKTKRGGKKPNKRRVVDDDDSSLSSEDSLDHVLNVISGNDDSDSVKHYVMPFYKNSDSGPALKKAKRRHFTAEIVVEIADRDGNIVPIRAPLDTGTSSTLLLKEFVKKGRASSYKGKRVTWATKGGTFETRRKALVDFKFPRLESHKSISWIVHVDDSQ
jgi:hypothetical protein